MQLHPTEHNAAANKISAEKSKTSRPDCQSHAHAIAQPQLKGQNQETRCINYIRAPPIFRTRSCQFKSAYRNTQPSAIGSIIVVLEAAVYGSIVVEARSCFFCPAFEWC
ncbi:hypothetical protein Nepgr_021672 [Nepenthes gracilis]|uniref:Uncharacterized protein n=1 Tax=Nepenthes gracilis TaxID=150966 RepID=A0AAD3XXL5_NEPGR|nr:hypothetical protein Nepgr_021672 [Nepenthes gracilis]